MSRVITGKEHCEAASSIKAVRCCSVAQDQCPASESTENVPFNATPSLGSVTIRFWELVNRRTR